MSDITFTIIEADNCPLYKLNDTFMLSDNKLTLSCKTICIDLVNAINAFMTIGDSLRVSAAEDGANAFEFNCSGCLGAVRLACQRHMKKDDDSLKSHDTAGNITRLLNQFSLFKTLTEQETAELLALLKVKQYAPGVSILKKGEPGQNLMVITSGKVQVSDDDVHISYLGKGDIFGEMSLLSGEPVTADIKTVEKTNVLSIDSRNFRKVINTYPSLQLYLAKLLTKRLAKATMERTVEMSAAVSGNISETSPSEIEEQPPKVKKNSAPQSS